MYDRRLIHILFWTFTQYKMQMNTICIKRKSIYISYLLLWLLLIELTHASYFRPISANLCVISGYTAIRHYDKFAEPSCYFGEKSRFHIVPLKKSEVLRNHNEVNELRRIFEEGHWIVDSVRPRDGVRVNDLKKRQFWTSSVIFRTKLTNIFISDKEENPLKNLDFGPRRSSKIWNGPKVTGWKLKALSVVYNPI